MVITACDRHLWPAHSYLLDLPPVVFVHGWGGGAALWFNNLGDISKHARVFAVDWRGRCALQDVEAEQGAETEQVVGWQGAEGQTEITSHSLQMPLRPR